MLIYFLFFSVFVLLLLTLIIWQGELFSPSVIICAGFLVSILSAIYNIERWGISLHWNTYCVIVGGLFFFLAVSFSLRIYYQKKYLVSSNPMVINQINEIHIDNWKICFLIICTLIISLVYYIQVRKIVGVYKGNMGWTETMHWFRHYVSFGYSNMKVPGIVEQSYQMMNLIGYVCIYILVHNFVASGKIKKNLFMLCILLLASSFLNSSRLDLIRYPVAAITIYILLIERKSGKTVKLRFKLLFKLAILFLAICVSFVWLKKIAGRIDDRTPFYYITYYLGQSIRNLDCFLQEKSAESDIWGKETFYGLNHFLGIITGQPKFDYVIHKEFRYYKGQATGNVYTMFRAFIHDFGYAGLCVLTVGFSFIINAIYLNAKSKKYKNTKIEYNVVTIFYSYIVFSVYVAFFADYFWTTLVSAKTVKLILAFFIGYIFLVRLKIKCAR